MRALVVKFSVEVISNLVDEYSEKFTADFLLLSIGCIAVSGGLEVA
jgi:hypothetical protein